MAAPVAASATLAERPLAGLTRRGLGRLRRNERFASNPGDVPGMLLSPACMPLEGLSVRHAPRPTAVRSRVVARAIPQSSVSVRFRI